MPPTLEDEALVRNAFIQLLTREPTAAEMAASTTFLRDRAAAGATPARARELFQLALLNHHEFLTLR